MTRIHNRLVGKNAIFGCVAILIALLVGAAACQPSFAQGNRTPRRGQPGQPGPLDRLANPGGVQPQEADSEPEEAEPEENTTEREYAEMPVSEDLKKSTGTINEILSKGRFGDSAERDLFDDYFQKYFLARWSRIKGPKGDITNFPKERRDFHNCLVRQRGGVTEVHDHLNELALDFMKKLVVGKDYHPAVRVNAMLMIGELNRVEQTGGQDAVPLPEAFTILLKAADGASFPTGIRAAAMIGILRHAKAGIQDEDIRRSLGATMVKLVTADRPTGAAAPGHAWLVAQCAETLGVLGSMGENNAVFPALIKTVADNKLPFFARSAATVSIGRLSYSANAQINLVEAAVILGEYASDICEDELRLAKSASASVSRRRALQRLDAVRSALDGVDGGTGKGIVPLAREPGQQAFLVALQKLIKDACELLDNKSEDDRKMKPAIESLQKNLKTWLEKRPK